MSVKECVAGDYFLESEEERESGCEKRTVVGIVLFFPQPERKTYFD